MFRNVLLQSARCVSKATLSPRVPFARSIVPPSYFIFSRPTPVATYKSIRCYSAPAGLTQTEVEERIIDLLKGFDKVEDASKLSGNSHFSKDLGLDSLDTVEVVMAIEEEFSIEIPDKEADAIHSIDQAVRYILSQPDAH